MKLDDRKDIDYINGPVSYIEVNENTSFMNLRELPNKEEVPITKFGVINPETNEFKQNVFTNLDVYYSEYNKQLKSLDGTIRLITEPVKEYEAIFDSSLGGYIQTFFLYDQRYTNFFLFENGNLYLYLNREMSLNLVIGYNYHSYIKIENWSCEINELNKISPGKIMLAYYASRTGNKIIKRTIKETRSCTNLYIVNGTIENDNLVSMESNEIPEMSSNFLGFTCNNIYSTNCIIEESKNTNIIMNGEISSSIYNSVISDDKKTINAIPCGVKGIEIGIKGNNSSIDLTNVADSNPILSVSNKFKKKVYVSKVDILERFKDKIKLSNDIFTYYDGIEEKPSIMNYVKDWALELPECYEGCELDENMLTVNFGEYLQLGDNYLLDNLENNSTYELDLSMKTDLDLSNVTTLCLNLDTLKFIKKGDFNVYLQNLNNVHITFNKDGFLKRTESISISDQNIKNCCLMYGDYVLKDDTYFITPLGTMLDNDEYITFDSYFELHSIVNNLKCTNTCWYSNSSEHPKNQEFNLLLSGDLTNWVNKYFKDSEKILPITLKYTVKEDGKYKCEILESDYSGTDCFKVSTINALPAPGIGIHLGNGTTEDYTSSMDLSEINFN